MCRPDAGRLLWGRPGCGRCSPELAPSVHCAGARVRRTSARSALCSASLTYSPCCVLLRVASRCARFALLCVVLCRALLRYDVFVVLCFTCVVLHSALARCAVFRCASRFFPVLRGALLSPRFVAPRCFPCAGALYWVAGGTSARPRASTVG